MRHLIIGRKFSRHHSHRKAMFQNMTKSLLCHEIIKTTLPKAKELRTFVEPLITLGKSESHLRLCLSEKKISSDKFNSRVTFLRRKAFSYLRNKVVIKKLFEDIAPRYKERSGGYTQIIKCGFRKGDKSPMAIIKLVI